MSFFKSAFVLNLALAALSQSSSVLVRRVSFDANSLSSCKDDSALAYTGQWTHDADGPATLYNGTQSWTNDPTATLTFSFTGVGFDFCSGQKADRGQFTYSIDGQSAGSGSETGPGMQQAPKCVVVASVRNLQAGPHSVVISNSGATYFAADSITIYANSADSISTATSQSPVSTSTTTATQASRRSSASLAPAASSLVGVLPVVTSSASSNSASSSSSGASHKAVVIALPLLSCLLVAAVGFLLFLRHQRNKRTRQNRQSATDNFDRGSFHWDYEKGPDMVQRPAESASNGRKSPLGIVGGVFNKNHTRLHSQLSLESNTEPFQPRTLSTPPMVEPYVLPGPQQQNQPVYAAYASPYDAPQPALSRATPDLQHPQAIGYPQTRYLEPVQRSSIPSMYADTVYSDRNSAAGPQTPNGVQTYDHNAIYRGMVNSN